MKATLIDRIVLAINPKEGLKRVMARDIVEKSESIYHTIGRNQQTKNYSPFFPTDPNFGVSANIEAAHNRSSGLYFENAVAAGIINAMVDGSIGTGLVPQSKANNRILKLEQSEVDKTQRLIEAYWNIWANSPEMCDHYGKQTFGSLQREAFINASMCGDMLQHIKIVKVNGAYLPQIQNIAGNSVKNEFLVDSKSIAGGVEVDASGREIAYMVAEAGNDLISEKITRVPKYGTRTGRMMYNLVMLGQVVPGQRRGRSVISRVAEPIIQMGRYNEAELTKAILQSYMTLFIETAEGHEELPYDDPIAKLTEASNEAIVVRDALGNVIEPEDAPAESPLTLGPGMINVLAPGQKAVLPESKSPVSEFWKFMEANLKFVGMAVGIPYEVLLKAFNSNYSASQAAIQDAARGWKILATEWAYKYCFPVFEQFVDMLVRQNLISCPGFDNPMTRKAWLASEWFGPVVLNIDPVKNMNTAKLAIDNRLSTREIEARKLFGNDWEAVNERLGEEEAMILNVGGVVPVAGDEQKPQEEDKEDDE